MNKYLIRTKLVFIVVLAMFVLGAVGGAGGFGIFQITEKLNAVSDRLASVSMLLEIRIGQLIVANETMGALSLDLSPLEASPDQQGALREVYAYFGDALLSKRQGDDRNKYYYQQYAALAKTPSEQELAEVFAKELTTFRDASQHVDEAIKTVISAQDWSQIRLAIGLLRNEQLPLFASLRRSSEILDKMIDAHRIFAIEMRRESEETRDNVNSMMLIVTLLGMLGLAAMGYVIVRGVVGAVEYLRKTMLHVANTSDFTCKLDIIGRDELAQASDAFNTLLDGMRKALLTVLVNASQVSNSVRMVRDAAEKVLSSSDAQHKSASEMSAAMEQMAVSITHIAESSQQAKQRSKEAGAASNEGTTVIFSASSEMENIGRAVQRAGGVMDEVGNQSAHISTIIQVIQEVAAQTNLLALNAAIEAARAGEQGRGFAVVADEVRKLAERTTNSAAEIKDMISAMQAKSHSAIEEVRQLQLGVETGMALTSKATEQMLKIDENSNLVAGSIDEISAALAEQSATTQEIARKVETVASMSQSNREAVAATVQVAAEIDQLSEALQLAAGKFRV